MKKKEKLYIFKIKKGAATKNAAFLYVKSTFTFCFVRGTIYAYKSEVLVYLHVNFYYSLRQQGCPYTYTIFLS